MLDELSKWLREQSSGSRFLYVKEYYDQIDRWADEVDHIRAQAFVEAAQIADEMALYTGVDIAQRLREAHAALHPAEAQGQAVPADLTDEQINAIHESLVRDGCFDVVDFARAVQARAALSEKGEAAAGEPVIDSLGQVHHFTPIDLTKPTPAASAQPPSHKIIDDGEVVGSVIPAATSEDAYVAKRMSETLADVYMTILGDDTPDTDENVNAIERVKKAASVLRLEVELYRASANPAASGQKLTDEQRDQLELIDRCDPTWLVNDIRKHTHFDAKLLEQVFDLAKERARSLLAASDAQGGAV